MNLWTGIIIGAIALGVYGMSKLKNASGQLVTEVKGRIHSMDFTKLVFAIDATIKNPTETEIVIKYPFIKIAYKDSVIASSELLNQTIRIAPYSQTNIKNIKLPIQYLSITGIAGELIKKLQNRQQQVTVQCQIVTTIMTGVKNIPYSITKDITI